MAVAGKARVDPRSLLSRFDGAVAVSRGPHRLHPQQLGEFRSHEVCDPHAACDALVIARASGVVVMDCEWGSTEEARWEVLSLYMGGEHTFVIRVANMPRFFFDRLLDLFADGSVTKVFHGARNDLRSIARSFGHRVPVVKGLACTLEYASMLRIKSQPQIDALVRDVLGGPHRDDRLSPRVWDRRGAYTDRQLSYSGGDAYWAYHLYLRMSARAENRVVQQPPPLSHLYRNMADEFAMYMETLAESLFLSGLLFRSKPDPWPTLWHKEGKGWVGVDWLGHDHHTYLHEGAIVPHRHPILGATRSPLVDAALRAGYEEVRGGRVAEGGDEHAVAEALAALNAGVNDAVAGDGATLAAPDSGGEGDGSGSSAVVIPHGLF